MRSRWSEEIRSYPDWLPQGLKKRITQLRPREFGQIAASVKVRGLCDEPLEES